MAGARSGDVRAARARLRGRVLAIPGLTVRPITASDNPIADALLRDALGGRHQARRGELVDVLDGDLGLLAIDATGVAVGIVTWRLDDDARNGEISAIAVDELRRTLKPSIPVVGDDGIPLRDELELELLLG